jgi:hypothetical protein
MVLVASPSKEVYGEVDWTPLHVDSMDISVQCQINMAFVRMELLFTHPEQVRGHYPTVEWVAGGLSGWPGAHVHHCLGRTVATAPTQMQEQ